MKGERSGLKTRVLELNNKALYVHCFGHSLNLAVQDSIKSIPEVRDLLDMVYEVTKLIKYSPKRENILKTIKDEVKSSGGGVKSLCPTRYCHFYIVLPLLVCYLDNITMKSCHLPHRNMCTNQLIFKCVTFLLNMHYSSTGFQDNPAILKFYPENYIML